MLSQIKGLHHVTSLASSARENNAFFTNVLGLRRVKKTVNFDAPDVYHLYYGDEAGSPGTVMTYFPFPHAARGKRGTGEVGTTSFVIPKGTAKSWAERLGTFDIANVSQDVRFGETRVFDTGIREATIAGQGIGLAMRGLRPIAEIQYLDYLLYALEILSDDCATVRWRSAGGQKAPLIVRTRGHRLEGIWHSGSPMGLILGALRGMYVCVPRNMTQAAGMYNTLLQADEPALVIECLNGYRLKEKLPTNLTDFTVPLGHVEILRKGSDLTLVTYGSMCRLAQEAAERLTALDVDIEIIDAQTLLPFDRAKDCLASVQRTNRLLVVDEDVDGGASAYILQKIVEEQNAFQFLDAAPATLTAKAHRPAYGSDGDYFSKPSVEDIVDTVLEVVAR